MSILTLFKIRNYLILHFSDNEVWCFLERLLVIYYFSGELLACILCWLFLKVVSLFQIGFLVVMLEMLTFASQNLLLIFDICFAFGCMNVFHFYLVKSILFSLRLLGL